MLFVKLKLWIKQFIERDSVLWNTGEYLYKRINDCRRLKGSLGTLPDFLIIGVQKGGTTSLYHYLIQHPHVHAAVGKELTYFTKHFDKSLRWYRAHFPLHFSRRLASKQGNPFLTGEASTDYLHKLYTARRVRETVPDVHIIVLLRNPVERAHSHHNHTVSNGKEQLSFEEAVRREEERLDGELEPARTQPDYNSYEYQKHSYLTRGKYVEFLEPWFDQFSREQITVVKSEELFRRPKETTNNVFEFLGVEPYELDAYHEMNKREYDDLNPDLREELEAYFRPYNERLEELIGRDMDWF